MRLRYVGGLPGVDGSRNMEIRKTKAGIELFRGGFWNQSLEIRREDAAISYLPDLREASKKGSNLFAGASLGVGLATGGPSTCVSPATQIGNAFLICHYETQLRCCHNSTKTPPTNGTQNLGWG
jgi:hypothetical protein